MSEFHAKSFKAMPFFAPIWLLYSPSRAFPVLWTHSSLGFPQVGKLKTKSGEVFGKVLCTLRAERGLSQEALAL
jgi:hypothetical protein